MKAWGKTGGRGYYPIKFRIELENLIRRLSNQFDMQELEVIRGLFDALNDIQNDKLDEFLKEIHEGGD